MSKGSVRGGLRGRRLYGRMRQKEVRFIPTRIQMSQLECVCTDTMHATCELDEARTFARRHAADPRRGKARGEAQAVIFRAGRDRVLLHGVLQRGGRAIVVRRELRTKWTKKSHDPRKC